MRDVLKMRDVLLLLSFLLGAAQGQQLPSGGYCLGNQCFAVFQDSSRDFRGAQHKCSQQRGLLMTVRSSVAHDIVSILLGNSTGRYWIGLHIPKGCPDLSTELRGFQWVTTGTASDFYNWAPGFDSSCPSSFPRCVSVSKKDKFQWAQARCNGLAAGFLCEYDFQAACSGLAGNNILYTTPYGFRVEGVQSLPPGSVAEPPDENKQVCFSGQWLRAPWSCDIQRGGCEHKCTTDPQNNPVCYCPPGQAVSLDNRVRCEVALDDRCEELKCDHACYVYAGSYLCACDYGFTLAKDNRSCMDFDECSDKKQCPEDNERCVNTQGSFQCVCMDGYQLRDGLCMDVNECVSSPCEHICTNRPGGYECSCDEGYKVDPDSPDKCELHCGQEECPAECDPNDRYQCECPDGYILEERVGHSVCIDINECDTVPCDHFCDNLYGSYECFCKKRFKLVDGHHCELSGDLEGSTEVMPVTSIMPVTPTQQPSAMSLGGLVGIIVCTVFFILLAVFLIHHILHIRGKRDNAGALKAPESPEAHRLQPVTP